eukprot:NODE_2931_length_1086_cov_35.082932_g2688_i0.p1 GENE.NODE_2931_length_1086_cov_35.082932_g2688_i0~~NODE_2931_length_1086_cov_35.082932_g2688_i0.p1  ORF type:complete len:167 (-),score=24.83 NODE_2931_length_1086_cov_35.082932_g2688_i0:435-935(-)
MASNVPPSGAAAPKPKDPEKEARIRAIKEYCQKLYQEPAYGEADQEYLIGDFRWSKKKIVNVSSTQVFRGLADEEDKPHGWGIMQNHNGFSQDCSAWFQGVANGRGSFRDPDGGVFYGTWKNGKRDGTGCSINKERQMCGPLSNSRSPVVLVRVLKKENVRGPLSR